MPDPKAVNSALYNTVRKDVARYVRNKLRSMELDVTALELHNSSSTKTLRVYVTVSRTTNLKALYLAETIVCKELEKEFGLHPHAFYWRYFPERKAAEEEPSSPAH
ncbi:hypothetical protein LXA47_05030 [Massilia sp. P8910]|uniref:hypothetical protein n=1 Tax=Massilia antarctica TaxID=2765360 RepID=UPI0006BB92DD|nr:MULTISPECIES: hypothetical protein [Massilia]MCE3602967.1 hypothetical protein [Massilia antarctica]MCY0915500.1 hypothetical protein [Massilia sp. H27-R4]CUI04148.1 hypothetical protein BN2497_3073 [Janthinobacterium sp. CG23_2]CUU27934.1 hypothetical protein BN3177_3073 [Janthinobacterium sp. CG23_2]